MIAIFEFRAVVRVALVFACVFLVTGFQTAAAQQASMRGLVTDRDNGEPLPGVNVVLRNRDGAVLGASTDTDGYYLINRIDPGSFAVSVSYVGYETTTEEIDFAPGRVESRNFSIAPVTITGEEVVISGEDPRRSVTTAGLQVIRPAQLELVPMPDISGDLMGYLQILPGMVTPGDRGGQLFVRGGTPSQNLTLVDGMPIHQPFHIIGFFSAFPADIVRQADVYAGGFGSSYGGRLSSVIDVSTRNGNKQKFEASASIAPFLSAIHMEGPLAVGKSSFIASWRESMVERLLPDVWSGAEPFRFGDQFLKVHSNLKDGSQFSATMLRTHDRGLIDETEAFKTEDLGDLVNQAQGSLPTGPEEQIRWINDAYGFRYFVVPEDRAIIGEVTGALTIMENETGPIDNPDRFSQMWTMKAAGKLTHFYGPARMEWGATAELLSLDYYLGGIFQNLDTDDDDYVDVGSYLNVNWPIGDGLSFNPGVHFHVFSGAATSTRLEPRIRAVWLPFGSNSGHELSAAWGLYHQNLVGLQDERDAGDVFTAWTFSPYDEDIPGAMHAIVGWQFEPTPWFEIGLEGYYKTMTNLSIPAWSPFPRFTTTLIPADGEVKGGDLRMSVDFGSVYGYIGYGLQEVVYNARQESFGVWYGTAQESFSPPHDRRHQLNMLLSVDLGLMEVDLRWEFGSGLPFTRPIGFDDWILFETLVDVTKDPGEYRVAFERPYQGRLPTYHRLDLSVKQGFELPRAKLTLQAGVINAYDRANLFYYDVWTLRRVDQLSLMPTFGIKVETL